MSIMFDCWKNNCQGATVVPMMAMMSRTDVDVKPPLTPGTVRPCKKGPVLGWLKIARGITKKFTITKKYMNRSQLRKLPEAVMRINATAAMGTAMYSLMPKYSRARLTQMNSVVIVRKFKMKRSPTENAPQTFRTAQ